MAASQLDSNVGTELCVGHAARRARTESYGLGGVIQGGSAAECGSPGRLRSGGLCQARDWQQVREDQYCRSEQRSSEQGSGEQRSTVHVFFRVNPGAPYPIGAKISPREQLDYRML